MTNSRWFISYLKRCLLLVGLCLLLIPIPISAQITNCPGALPSRMVVNQPGRVIAPNGTNLRAAPGINGELVGGAPVNAEFTVLDGPVCADGFTWWEIAYRNRVGWSAEGDDQDYWLESLSPLYQPIRYENVELLVDYAIARNIGVERKERAPLYRGGAVELVTLPHVRFAFPDESGLANVSVFPVAEYNALLGGGLDSLHALLNTRPDYLDMFALPAGLPATDVPRLLTTQPRYLNFDGGTGVRFIGYFDYESDGVDSGDLYYVYLGLTDDNSRLVQVFLPVQTGIVPPLDATPWVQYLAQVQSILDNADSAQFTPTLNTFDDLIDKLKITPQTPPQTEDIAYARVRFSVNRIITRGARGETVQAAPASAPLPLPRHTSFYFEDFPTLDNQPQISVFPAAEYNFTFAGAIDELKRAMITNSPTPEVPQRLPIIANKTQVLIAQPQIITFQNGRGLRFLTYLRGTSEPIRPITAARVAYVFVGLTSDELSFVQVLVPLNATMFPEVQPADFDAVAFASTYEDYLAQARRDLNAASPQSFEPRLDALDAMVQSIEVTAPE